MNLMSDDVFRWILTGFVGGVSSAWLVYDTRNLRRSLSDDRRDPLVRDHQFGYAMGIAIALIGIVGALRFHGVI